MAGVKHMDTFCSMVEEAIQDELGAVSMYAKMATMVDNDNLRTIIMGIAGDEYGHARTWMTVLELYCCD